MTEKLTQKNVSIFAVLTLMVAAGLVGSLLTSSVSAAEENDDSQKTCRCSECGDGSRGDVREAIEENDFIKFQEAVAGSSIADQVADEETFARFVEAHELIQNRDIEGAKGIFKELGVKGPRMHGRFGSGFGCGSRFDSHQAEE